MFTLEQMQTLIAIVDEGSLSKAAKKLGKTKGTISTTLNNLEVELGVELFDRSGWQLKLTETGARVYNQALLLQRQAFHILSTSQVYAEGVESSVRLGIQNIIPAIELHSRLERFRSEYPFTRLHLVRGDDDSLVQWLKNGEIDLLVRVQTGAAMEPNLEYSNAGLLEFVFACAPDYHLTDVDTVDNEQLLSNPQIILDLGSEYATNLQRVSYDPIVAANREDFLYQVELGQAWCLLPKSLFLERAAIGGLSQIKPSFEGEHITVAPIEMVCSLNRVVGPALHSLKEAISACESC